MRMWMVNPKFLCKKHLGGEHYELHMLTGSISKNKNIKGFLESKLVFPEYILKRHGDLVVEMEKRGWKHKSELIIPDNFIYSQKEEIDIIENYIFKNYNDLFRRCEECRKRIKN